MPAELLDNTLLEQLPIIDISFYPGFDEFGIYQAREKAMKTIWQASTQENPYSQDEISRQLKFAIEQHDLGIKIRNQGDYARSYEYFARSENIARKHNNLGLLSESLAHQVDLNIAMARNTDGVIGDSYKLVAMQHAVESFTYAEYLGRDDLNWFGWKVFEAACETKNWKYAAHYWFVTTGLENGIVKSFPDTLNYGTRKIKKMFQR